MAGPWRFIVAERNFNDRYLQRLPATIRTWFGISVGLPWRMVWLEGEEAAQRVGRCLLPARRQNNRTRRAPIADLSADLMYLLTFC